MAESLITIEVVYAAVDRQLLLKVDVPDGVTLRTALLASSIEEQFPELDLASCPVGIFGKQIIDPERHVIQAGDRIEIYRPLLADPKEVRRLRALKAAEARKREQ
ncbi:RnfH family protein [Pseudomonas sp. Fl5BN2]|uniref:RnfH family protein n=1 Tax=unclassified Pseudomonas TaxID=196821 RepID=UPI0013770EB0|nr:MULTISPECIES: RnfH family protein [unclassified Pseudomonas]NBF02491.1 RnfH family protein [Pseudomonas sp. Fl5BN2]NBF11399.1 RnfH family protein [Pseudomonas sp. Fl4BN1]